MITTEPLSIEVIREGLQATVVGQPLYLFGEVASTNTVLRDLASAGATEGTVVLAEAQRLGRGRLGQEWFSPPGVNLYASVLFRERLTAREAGPFSLIAGLALADAVRALGIQPAIKWPNDVLVEGRKVGGSLTECVLRADTVDFLVLGVGVNLNVSLESLRRGLGEAATSAISLASAMGREIDRNAFAVSYLRRLDEWALRYRRAGGRSILDAWRDLDILTGRRVTVGSADTPYDGRVLGVNDEAQLIVQDSLGRQHVVLAEEIRAAD